MTARSFKEQILVGRLKLKDKEAFAELYDVYVDRIYRFIFFKVATKEEAEDITSQVFLKIWQYALEGRVKAEKSFQALLYKIARNSVIDHYRGQKIKKQSDISLDQLHAVASTEDVAEKTAKKMEIDLMVESIKQLKDEYQEIIILYYLNELSVSEIAAVLDKRKGAIRVTLHRALKTLKKQSIFSEEKSK